MTKAAISQKEAKEKLELIIRLYLKTNQKEAKRWALDIENTRNEQLNEFASSRNTQTKFGAGKLRLGSNLPLTLLKAIEKQFPDVFKDEKQYEWFMKTFRIFTIPRKL